MPVREALAPAGLIQLPAARAAREWAARGGRSREYPHGYQAT